MQPITTLSNVPYPVPQWGGRPPGQDAAVGDPLGLFVILGTLVIAPAVFLTIEPRKDSDASLITKPSEKSQLTLAWLGASCSVEYKIGRKSIKRGGAHEGSGNWQLVVIVKATFHNNLTGMRDETIHFTKALIEKH